MNVFPILKNYRLMIRKLFSWRLLIFFIFITATFLSCTKDNPTTGNNPATGGHVRYYIYTITHSTGTNMRLYDKSYNKLWEVQLPGKALFNMLVNKEKLIISLDNDLYAYELNTGNLLWYLQGGYDYYLQLACKNDTLYCTKND